MQQSAKFEERLGALELSCDYCGVGSTYSSPTPPNSEVLVSDKHAKEQMGKGGGLEGFPWGDCSCASSTKVWP
jgi:hypothetical protein